MQPEDRGGGGERVFTCREHSELECSTASRGALREPRAPTAVFNIPCEESRGLDPRLLSLSLAGQARNTPPQASQEIVEARRLKAAEGESGSVGVSFQISLVLAAAPGTSDQVKSEALQSRTDRAAAASSHALIIR